MPVLQVRWRAIPREELSWRDLDDELVLRNARTGNTHLLEPLGADVLRALMQSDEPLTAAELAIRLRDEESDDDQWQTSIETALSEFQRLGLAQPTEA